MFSASSLVRFFNVLAIGILVAAVYAPRSEANGASSIVGNVTECFSNPTIYKSCDEQFRLTVNGTLNVNRTAVDAFCSGPCLAETEQLLRCIDGILSNFEFYNGATTKLVNSTLILACGTGFGRGNFSIPATATPPTSPPTKAPAPAPATSHGGRLLRPCLSALTLWGIGSVMFTALA